MALTVDEVRQVALLSRLHLSEEEIRLYAEQIGDILEYMKKLDEADTSKVQPMISATTGGNVFRPDEPSPGLKREEALHAAPNHDGEYFRVPPVIDPD